jgi:hypothetical protein
MDFKFVSISNPGKLYPVKNFVAKALLDRILKAAYAGEKFLVSSALLFLVSSNIDDIMYTIAQGDRMHARGSW